MENKYKTASGRVIEFEPISVVAMDLAEQGIKKRYAAEGKRLDPPTYEVEVVGGGVQTFEHDAESVKGNPEWEAAWAEYQENQKAYNAEVSKIRNEMVLDAIQVDPAEIDGWRAKQERWGIEIPTDPMELKIHYIQTVVVKSIKDIYGISEAVMALSLEGVISPEEIEAASKSFRRTLGDAKREAQAIIGVENEEGKVAA